jgi:hypothetical protein
MVTAQSLAHHNLLVTRGRPGLAWRCALAPQPGCASGGKGLYAGGRPRLHALARWLVPQQRKQRDEERH